MSEKIKGMIICGFPGVGKSTAATKSREIVDCESTAFHYPADWAFYADNKNMGKPAPKPVENPNWVSDYVDQIEIMASENGYPFVLVSTHLKVREEMDMRGIPYIVVVPKKDAKDEYMARYLMRGDRAEFIQTVYDYWDEWLDEIETHGAPVIHLNKGQVLKEIMP